MSGPILLIIRLAITLVLYAFLGWALYMLWLDLKRETKSFKSSVPALTLIQHSEAESRSYRFTYPEITIGRDPAADCWLEDQTISARHARLSFHHNQWWIEDLHSTNGTFLNQDTVSEPMVIAAGDLLRCGQVLLEIALGENNNHILP